MIRSDNHSHTEISGDCKASSTSMLLAAKEKKLTYYTITDHHDLDFPDCGIDFKLDIDDYLQKLDQIVVSAPSDLTVLKGIEFGLQAHLGPALTALNQLDAFDFIIGSCHLAYGEDPYNKSFFQNRTQEEGYRRCFEAILENVTLLSGFDSLGHLDYTIRYWRGEGSKFYRYKDYQDILDPILKTLIKKDIALEVNTAGYVYKLGQPNPGYDVLSRYHELGGELLTIGSDAHLPANVASHFDVVEEKLKAIGFKSYTTFIKRKPHQMGFE